MSIGNSEADGRSRRTVLTAMGVMAGSMAGAMAAGTAQAAGESGTEAVTAAVEALRVAIQSGDAKALDALTHAQLTYGHSSGRKIQDKAAFIASLAGKENYRTLVFSEPWMQVVGNNALVRHVWDGADILPDGQIGRSYIAVLQVWLKEGDRWRLLARQACPLKPAA